MNILIDKSSIHRTSEITITGSKSESNRLLLLQALFPEITLDNLSNSDDSTLMKKALMSKADHIDIHHAGTAMRFLTAYFSIQTERTIELTGSDRMKERPIQILVDALRQLGADISYLEKDGFPPLKIKGKTLIKSEVTLNANVSSQYISALLLIAPKLDNGIALTLEGEITSLPYINMTLDLLKDIGVETTFENQVITVKPKVEIEKRLNLTIESDWSSASYFYSIIALSPVGTELSLSYFKKDSLQGDSVLTEIYKAFGVETRFNAQSIHLKKIGKASKTHHYNLKSSPDIAQTIAVTCFALGLDCDLTGLHTLKIKETDRLAALQNELQKLGAKVNITEDSIHIKSSEKCIEHTVIATYNDHRMAMAFAPLALKVPLQIEDANVVSKSYPTFWDDLKSIGFQIK